MTYCNVASSLGRPHSGELMSVTALATEVLDEEDGEKDADDGGQLERSNPIKDPF